MKILIVLCLALSAFAQTQTKVSPDCTLGPSAVSFTTTGNSIAYDNRPVSSNTGIPCANWSLVWSAEAAVTSLTIKIEAAPDSNGTPGTFTSIASGSTFPSGKVDIATATGYYPWIRVSVTAVGSPGAITGILNGWRDNADTIGGGGGGGGGCTAPCVVIGPDSVGSAPTEPPVAAGFIDGAGNIIPPQVCSLHAFFDTSSSGNTLLVGASGSDKIYLCHFVYQDVAFGNTVQVKQGTGATCAGSTTNFGMVYVALAGAAEDYDLSPLVTVASNAICINLANATRVTGEITYGQH
jgi:hypothetical protein